jgi:hypothetical protein
MQAPQLRAGEIDILTGLAARLIAEQLPRPEERLDAFLTHGVLARLAPLLPVPIPALIAQGQPAANRRSRRSVAGT